MTTIFEFRNKKNEKQILNCKKKKITVTIDYNKFPMKTLSVKKLKFECIQKKYIKWNTNYKKK